MGDYRQTEFGLAAMVAHLEPKFHNSHTHKQAYFGDPFLFEISTVLCAYLHLHFVLCKLYLA